MELEELKNELKRLINKDNVASDVIINELINAKMCDRFFDLFIEISDEIATKRAERSENNAV